MKFAAISYSTENIGDDIQTIAAMQFYPRVDFFVDREKMSLAAFKQKAFMIANGWYLQDTNFFPPKENIVQFFVSVHIASSRILTKKIVDYFKKNEPIGCRDTRTLQRLRRRGINCFFSKDIVLTLKNKEKKRNNKVLFVDIDKKERENFPKELLEKAVFLSHYTKEKNIVTRFALAKRLLKEYARAKLVITRRLHCATACLAFNTPVIFFSHAGGNFAGKERYSSINCFLPVHSFADTKSIGWNPVVPDVSEQASFLSELCKRAVIEQQNPLKGIPRALLPKNESELKEKNKKILGWLKTRK